MPNHNRFELTIHAHSYENAFPAVLANVNGREFRVHKYFLAATSPVFKAMFNNGMVERSNNEIISKKIFNQNYLNSF